MSNNNNHTNKNAVNVERRTWDVATYEEKALARQQQQQQQQQESSSNNDNDDATNTTIKKEEFIAAPIGAMGPEGSQRAFLHARKRKVVDIDERVGSTKLLSLDDAVGGGGSANDSMTVSSSLTKNAVKITDGVKSSGIGFHCRVCDCYLKDSLTYLDHINGRKHQRALGYTMRVERSSESDVMNKLNELTKASEQQINQGTENDAGIDFNKIVQEKDIDEERRREERQRLRKERRKRHQEEIGVIVPKSGNQETTVVVQRTTTNDETGDGFDTVNVADDDDNNNDDEAEEDEEPMIDPAMAAMMGFTGFGGR